jgi:DNA polymerase-1
MDLLEPKICLVDGDIICYKIASNKKQTEEEIKKYGLQEERTWEQVKGELDEYLQVLMLKTSSTQYILALSVGECFRYNLYPEYKANRKDAIRPKYLDRIKEYLITDYKAIYYKGLEADDILCICSNTYKDSFIASIDKDLMQIPGLHFNLTSFKYDEVDEKTAKYNLFKQLLVGDSTDNIKGCPSIGKIGAEKAYSKDLENPSIFPNIALMHYIRVLGEDEGIRQFYLNYRLVKLLDKPEFGFVTPEPVNYELKITL